MKWLTERGERRVGRSLAAQWASAAEDKGFVDYKGTADGVHMSRRTNRGWERACGGGG